MAWPTRPPDFEKSGTFALDKYLSDCRRQTLDEIRSRMPTDDRFTGRLYQMILDYPQRLGKALRPALCIATARVFGGSLDAVLPSAAALELYHNAFLVHDDIEDGSELRRSTATMHRLHGVPVAINVGDGMLAFAQQALMQNFGHLGLNRALRILEVMSEMAMVAAEGQAMELTWIHDGEWAIHVRDYIRMIYKKSTHYSFVTPITVGAITANAGDLPLRELQRFGCLLGIAFQIHDDVLNLTGKEDSYGKEIDGDLWEGKRTVILLHALSRATIRDRARAISILSKARPDNAVPVRQTSDGPFKLPEDIEFLRKLIAESHSIDHARGIAEQHADRARALLVASKNFAAPSPHRDFLHALVDYVILRER